MLANEIFKAALQRLQSFMILKFDRHYRRKQPFKTMGNIEKRTMEFFKIYMSTPIFTGGIGAQRNCRPVQHFVERCASYVSEGRRLLSDNALLVQTNLSDASPHKIPISQVCS
jgi:hypothetical protein